MRYWLKLLGIPSLIALTVLLAATLAYQRLIFVIDHPLCFGSCPVYTVWVFRGGTIMYYGEHDTASTGLHLGHIDAEQIQQFSARYSNVLEHLPPIPPSNVIVSDVPELSIAFRQDTEMNHLTVKDTDGPRVALIHRLINELEAASQITDLAYPTLPSDGVKGSVTQ